MKQKSKNKEYLKLVISLGVLFLLLGGFLLYVSTPLLGTKKAVLAAQSVDPFSLVRGQHIIIRYNITSIPFIKDAKVGDSVYVSLADDANGISRYKSASLSEPSRDSLFIRGQIKYIDGDSMIVEYGIEQYFFERGARFKTKGMEVKVKLSDDGGARIVELLRDGEPIK